VLAGLNGIPALKDNVAVIGAAGGPCSIVFGNAFVGQSVLLDV
jgi:hypothetical protein